ncbi:mitochondrial 18 KDa protein-domain-containing protein [Penicillium sp. IBT 16267x]|nr:mitochondrial 18 KDa protein-domain-containing protein [Penicillium sp. IBT 16267x]
MASGSIGGGGGQEDVPPVLPPPGKPSAPGKLSPRVQELLDRYDYYDDHYSSYSVDSNDTNFRYAAYGSRIRTILLSAHRYVAYTSDIGESFRPVAHPWLIRSAYGISWAYLIGDVSHEGYKAYLRNRRALIPPGESYKDASDVPQTQIIRGMATGNLSRPLNGPKDTLEPWPRTEISLAEDYRMVMAKRAVFQSLASMGLPALTIHSVVKYSGRMLKGSKVTFLRTWMPIGLGLSVVPFLPYFFDHPVEEAVDWAFGTALRIYGGEDAVRPLPAHNRNGHADGASGGGSSATTAAGQLSWEEYKAERDELRQFRREQNAGKWWGVLGGWSGGDGKNKKE